MTPRPRPYHRAEAERLLDYADECAAQAGELSPEASERACLDRALVHALLAIHDALTAAGPAPTNPLTATHPWPATLPDTPSGQAFTARDKEAMDAVRARINALGEWLPVMEEALTPEPDPLDEDDWSDRNDSEGKRWARRGVLWCLETCTCDSGSLELDQIDAISGPLTFAPEPPQEAAGGDLSASQPEGERGEGGGADDAQGPR